MAQQNFAKLASQGRAYDASRAWKEEELAALLALESTCGLQRSEAAEYVRNGILSVAQYEKSKEIGFAPKSQEDLIAEAVAAHQKMVQEALGAEVVSEPEVVPEPEAVVETVEVVSEPEVVPEPEEVDASKAASNKKGGKK